MVVRGRTYLRVVDAIFGEVGMGSAEGFGWALGTERSGAAGPEAGGQAAW